MMKTKLISALLLCLASLPVSANVSESQKTVTLVGSQVGSYGYVAFAEGVNANCVNGALYFDISKPLGKTMFATLLTARTTSQKVNVTYTVPAATGMCYLEGASI